MDDPFLLARRCPLVGHLLGGRQFGDEIVDQSFRLMFSLGRLDPVGDDADDDAGSNADADDDED